MKKILSIILLLISFSAFAANVRISEMTRMTDPTDTTRFEVSFGPAGSIVTRRWHWSDIVDAMIDSIETTAALVFTDLTGMTIPATSTLLTYSPIMTYQAQHDNAFGVWLSYHLDSASPADDDEIVWMSYSADDDGGTQTVLGSDKWFSEDVTNTTESGKFTRTIMSDGSNVEMMAMSGENLSIVLTTDTLRLEAINGSTPVLRMRLANDGALSAVPIQLYHKKTNPSDNAYLSNIVMSGDDSGNSETNYASILSQSADVTNTDEAGKVTHYVALDGSLADFMHFNGYNGSVGQGETIFNEGGLDIDERHETADSANALVIDAGANKLGYMSAIGDSTHKFGGGIEATGGLVLGAPLKVGAYTLPHTDGSLNYVLKTDGAGTVSWQADATGTGGANYADSLVHNSRHVTGDSIMTEAEILAQFIEFGDINLSSELAALIDDEVGTDYIVFNNSPTFADDIQLGQNGADGVLKIYSEQGGTDYTASLYANTAMTSAASFFLPADEPAGTYLLNMTTGGVIGFDSNTYAPTSGFAKDLTTAAGLDGGGDDILYGSDSDVEISLDLTETTNITWSDGVSSGITHTFAVVGTDPTWYYSDGLARSGTPLQVGKDGTDGYVSIYSDQGATDWKAFILANTAMTGNASFYFPADEPTDAAWMKMSAGGVMSYDYRLKDIVTDTGLDGGENDVLLGADADLTLSLDLTELTNITWSDGASASVAHTFANTGTNVVNTYSSGLMTTDANFTMSRTGADATMTIARVSGTTARFVAGGGGGAAFQTTNNYPLLFGVNGQTDMYFSTSHYVGVGLGFSSPGEVLHAYSASNDIYIKAETDKTNGVAGLKLTNDAITCTQYVSTNDDYVLTLGGTTPVVIEDGATANSIYITATGILETQADTLRLLDGKSIVFKDDGSIRARNSLGVHADANLSIQAGIYYDSNLSLSCGGSNSTQMEIQRDTTAIMTQESGQPWVYSFVVDSDFVHLNGESNVVGDPATSATDRKLYIAIDGSMTTEYIGWIEASSFIQISDDVDVLGALTADSYTDHCWKYTGNALDLVMGIRADGEADVDGFAPLDHKSLGPVNNNGMRNMSKLASVHTKAIQELYVIIRNQDLKIKQLEDKINDMDSKEFKPGTYLN